EGVETWRLRPTAGRHGQGKVQTTNRTGGESHSGTKIRRGVSPVRVRVPPPALADGRALKSPSIHPLWRLALLATGLDALLSGGWAALRPEALLAWLDLAPTPDRLLAARALGGLVLTHAAFLGFAAARPGRWGGLAWVALAGRALAAGVWLWLWL